MTHAQLKLRQLCDCPEHLSTVGTWIYEEWWRKPGNTPEVVLRLLRSHTAKDTVPFTVVALLAGRPVGSCCVIPSDCVHRPQYAPWVAAVYVLPESRRQGVASALLREAARVAARVPVEGLYIDCHVQTAPVYAKNGWRILESAVGDPDSVVMFRSIRSEQGGGGNSVREGGK